MTITAISPKKGYTAAGGNTFAYPFKIADVADMLVYQNGILVVTGLSISGAGDPNGGVVTITPTPANGDKILLVRRTTRNQGTNWGPNDPDPAEAKENAFDKSMSVDQEQDEQLGRTPSYPISEVTQVNPTIDVPIVGKFARAKNSNGDVDWADPVVGGGLSVPVSLAQGGTGLAASSVASLLQSLGAANQKTATITPSAGVLTLPNPNDVNVVKVQGGNFAAISTTGVLNPTVLILFYVVGSNVLTDSATFRLMGRVNYTTVVNDFSIMYWDGAEWIEIFRSPATTTANNKKLLRADGTYQHAPGLNANVRASRASGTSIRADGHVPSWDGNQWQTLSLNNVTISNGGLAASTTYYLYVTPAGALELSTTVYAVDVDFQIPTKNGDKTRTLIALIRTNGSTQFADTDAQRFVLNWWNRKAFKSVMNFSADRTRSNTAYGEVNSEIAIEALVWADEAVEIGVCGGIAINSGNAGVGVSVDSTTVPNTTTLVNTAAFANVSHSQKVLLAEGLHTFRVLCATQSAITATFHATDADFSVAAKSKFAHVIGSRG